MNDEVANHFSELISTSLPNLHPEIHPRGLDLSNLQDQAKSSQEKALIQKILAQAKGKCTICGEKCVDGRVFVQGKNIPDSDCLGQVDFPLGLYTIKKAEVLYLMLFIKKWREPLSHKHHFEVSNVGSLRSLQHSSTLRQAPTSPLESIQFGK